MKTILFAAAALVAVGSVASAADLPVRVAAPVAARAACSQFGGGYIGGHGGSVWHDTRWNDRDAWAANEVSVELGNNVSSKKWGYNVGVDAGWNWQRGCTLWGVVADWSWSGLSQSKYLTDGQLGAALDQLRVNQKLDWFGTVRAKTGIIVDDVLVYLTGGFAYARMGWSASLTDNIGGVFVTETFAEKKTRWGGAVGLGTEWAINNNWSLSSEILYLQFADSDSTFNSRFAVNNGNPASKRFDQQDSIWVTKIGLNYRWGR